MLKKSFLMLVLSMVLVLSSSCGAEPEQVSTATETPVATPTASAATPSPEPQEIEETPVTPVFVVPDPTIRPVAVMIDNQGDKVLPQGGIAQAQIVYEMLVEFDITRYMAFFWGTLPDMVGPVRSSRHYFLDYAMEYDAVYTHVGGSHYATRDIAKLKIQNVDGITHGAAFWDLTQDKKNWQDTYTSKDLLEKQIARLKYRTEPKQPFPFQYHDTMVIPESGQEALDIFIKFASSGSTSGFLYNKEAAVYNRMRMGKPHIDRNTEEQVKATNIIVQEVASPRIENDTEGRRNLKNIGSGKGYFITGGKVVPIKWSKKARDAQTLYTTEDGKPIVLNPGQTWIEFVQDLNYVKIQ